MKKRLLSLALALGLSLGPAVPALADDRGASASPSAVSAGGYHTGLVDADGSLWMWGYNHCGQLGNGSTKYSLVPVKVLNNVVSVSCGDSHTAAIKADGSLWMWGYNSSGAVGNGGKYNVETGALNRCQTVPVKVMDGVASVSCRGDYTAAVKTDGSLWTWGANNDMQLGNGGAGNAQDEDYGTYQTMPVKVLDNVAAVSCGGSHAAAVKNDGTLWWWGYAGIAVGSQDGITPSLGQSYQPFPVKVLDNVAAVSCGGSHTAAIKTDGSLWVSGSNNDWGQLGDSSSIDAKAPTAPFKVLENVAAVSCGGGHTAAVKTDGSLWVWGDNQFGELGISGGNAKVPYYDTVSDYYGSFPVQTVPVKLMDGVATVSGGNAYTMIVKTDGSVWACGANEVGQLGNGGKHNSVDTGSRPVQTIPVKLSGLAAKVNLPAALGDVAAKAHYTDELTWAIEQGVISETGAATFSPEKVCTTGEILTFLWRAQNSPGPATGNPFSDVAASDYYYKAALWADEKGLVSGSAFGANVPCTRSMTVTCLWKLAGSPSAGKNSFTDVPAGADYAEAVAWAVSKGITGGTGNNTFSPDKTCTLGQIATFLYRDFAK